MINKLLKPRYSPKHKFKSKTDISKESTSKYLPPNLENFKHKLLSGNGFVTYK